ncbi:cyclin-like protein [Phakopsora pachyrhizi]|uniref:Cyclin-like protein n=1 Tax=Phakopsora pachyrhizi TaxID=170000 RepID=A0AAV0B4N2_PHAPC|nr:cyclin-like protein [Phakopsora pachyrhizi]CAH7677648.1 cyclin-like protein [Phakopsora pachyrhizi]
MDQWIWKPADMRSTPSRLVGIDCESENFLRGRAISWVIRISLLNFLQLPQLIIATASVYLHRFYMRKSVRRYSPKVMSATALFLATKAKEVPRKLEYIIREYLRIKENGDEIQPGNLKPDNFEESASFKQQILYFEGILLQTLCFDLAVDHPYTTLIQMVKNIHISHSRIRPIEKSLLIDMADWTKAKSLAQASWGFLSNSLMTPLCVIHRPEVIAAAAFLIVAIHWVIKCSTDHQAASDPSLPLGLDKSWLRSEVYHHLNLPDILNDPASEGSSKAQ